jgi:hypothetical protein
VISIDIVQLDAINLQSEVLQLRARIQQLYALLRVMIVVSRQIASEHAVHVSRRSRSQAELKCPVSANHVVLTAARTVAK